MKSGGFLSKVLITSAILMTSQFTFAQLKVCPSIDDLKKFSGFSVEYPLNLDINTQEPLTWLVAQNKVDLKKHVSYTLIQSPVKPMQGQYPLDAANVMIDALEALNNKPQCDDRISQNSSVCACLYWNPSDGSLASFLATEFPAKKAPTIDAQLKMSTKMMSAFKAAKSRVI